MTNKSDEINECELMPNMCHHGQCMNTPGSFECMCNRGYVYDTASHQCIDDNECNKNPCSGNAQCVNLPGSFECQCPEGYKHGSTFLGKYIVMLRKDKIYDLKMFQTALMLMNVLKNLMCAKMGNVRTFKVVFNVFVTLDSD